MISFQRTLLPWTVIGLMSLSVLALWGNFFRERPPLGTVIKEEADQPESPMSILADHLHTPWDLAFLPDGDLLVTELPGRLVRIGLTKRAHHVADVFCVGEAGLLGLALHPRFERNHWVYLFFTSKSSHSLVNNVVRYHLKGDELKKDRTILANIPAAPFHNGGKIVFGPDGNLYIATGDTGNAALAQDFSSLAGKILRMDDEGKNLEVFSYGHRNPLGLSWDKDDHLWASEAGALGRDKIHLVLQGSNYGWPKGKISRAAAIDGPAGTPWGIGQIAYGEGHLYAAGLLSQALYEIDLHAHPPAPETHLHRRFGRIRCVAFGPDGSLYLTTNNRDGRGQPHANDDKIIKIDPAFRP